MASEKRFGYEWSKYKDILPQYEKQFLGWVSPLTPDDFKNKVILDAGCGMGRNSYWPLKYGAKKVIAFDFDLKSVNAAKENLKEFPNAEVYYNSIYDIDFNNEFDIAFSIGVIHHLENPQKAIQNLARAVKPGGRVLIWVYAYQGNEWIVKFISPVRKLITSRLPPAFLNFLTYFVSLPFFIAVNIWPFNNPYLKQLKDFGFHHIHSIIFDQLLPEVANYWREEEAGNLLIQAGLKDIRTIRKNQNSWTVIGQKA